MYLQGLAEGGSAVISGVQGPKRFNTPVFCVVLGSGGQAALQAQLLFVLCAHSQPSPALWRRKLTAWVNSPSDVPVFRARPDSEGRSFVFEADDLGLW